MKASLLRNLAAVIITGMALSACGGSGGGGVTEAEMQRLATKYNMREKDKAVFKTCLELTAGKMPFVKMGKDIMQMSSVPTEVCGCQASTIASVFKADKVDAYAKFVKWIGNPMRNGAPNFTKKELAYESENKTIGYKLAVSLESCTRRYVADNEKASQKLMSPYVDKAAKKKKDEEAKAAAAKKAEAEG